ncbi:hypothetical protein DOTSEDRAFT_167008 [Dothistroma septosporum NZE10]|uniref:Enoyl reductase (ER) domain-containing protein n=1 Tax=Dothistroma septosporum (strain NZE10 / CBS 128990) TaxID=675120 RepID=N1PXK2_DOTSN|nr:hypothetical protein DOTSEDRAFT_167008 [Dothistroma septosporum NZE10]
MPNLSIPPTMKAWQYSSTKGGLEKNLNLNESAPLPKPNPDQHLIQVIAAALNPVDYKPQEIPFIARFLLPKPATPGIDVVGKVMQPANGSAVRPGQIIFGASGTGILAGGALAGYAVAKKDAVAVLPEGIDPVLGATVCIAGLTAHQSIASHVKDGSNVFINGGSGGTGIFGIQIAKAKGCYVTTSCSTPNVDLCKSLGADEVIDYKKQSVLGALKASGRKYDHVVDNVGHNSELYWKCHEYTTSRAVFVQVGASVSASFALESAAMRLLPGVLGGGQRKYQTFFADMKGEDLADIGRMIKNGQVKPVIDTKFPFEDAPKAFERLKTGRAKGKIVVEVGTDSAEAM